MIFVKNRTIKGVHNIKEQSESLFTLLFALKCQSAVKGQTYTSSIRSKPSEQETSLTVVASSNLRKLG